MSIPESQLDTWSHQGSVTQSAGTYATIKRALESSDAAYANRTFSVFLQGSYGNDTNIYADSDVDVVIELNSTFTRELGDLPLEQTAAFIATHSEATYLYPDFKRDVLAQLRYAFPGNYLVDVPRSRRYVGFQKTRKPCRNFPSTLRSSLTTMPPASI